MWHSRTSVRRPGPALALRTPRVVGGRFARTGTTSVAGATRGPSRPGLVRGICSDRPKTAWLFPGQGSQFPGMAHALFESEQVFRETVLRCADVLDGVLTQPLLEVLFDTGAGGEQALRDTTFAQPALFAVEMGLARLWQSWGIEPDVVLGHSVGQYAAACGAGVFGIDDGARLSPSVDASSACCRRVAG